MSKLRNLLIITSRYPHNIDTVSANFVFAQVEELKKYFDKVVVIATTPYTPNMLSKSMQVQTITPTIM